MPTVLVVDDDEEFRLALRMAFESARFTICEAENGHQGIEQAAILKPSSIVLDLGLPDKNGFAVAEALKQNPSTCGIPILVLTGHHRDGQMIESREHGADGYLVKGGPIEQVVGYVEALIKPLYKSEERITLGPLTIDSKDRIIYVLNKPTPKLTDKEFDLLCFLVKKSPEVVTWEKIAQTVWEKPARFGKDSRTIEVHLNRVRKKLGPEVSGCLKTHKGVGVQFLAILPSETG